MSFFPLNDYCFVFLLPFLAARVTRGEGGGLGMTLLVFLLEVVEGGVGVKTSSSWIPCSQSRCLLVCTVPPSFILLMRNLTQVVMISRMIITTAVKPRLYAFCTVKIKKIYYYLFYLKRVGERERFN